MLSPSTINVLLVEGDPGDALLLRSALRGDAAGSFSIRTVDRLDAAVAAVAVEPADVARLAAHQGVLGELGRMAVEDQPLDAQFARAGPSEPSA